jgi:hypothetical protein
MDIFETPSPPLRLGQLPGESKRDQRDRENKALEEISKQKTTLEGLWLGLNNKKFPLPLIKEMTKKLTRELPGVIPYTGSNFKEVSASYKKAKIPKGVFTKVILDSLNF